MSTIVAIGGGELGDFETLPIDREIVKYSRKKYPKVLFIPTASKDARGYWDVFQSVYKDKLKCKTDVLFLLDGELSKKQIEKKILSSDIIYVGGGNTLYMMQVWRKLGVDTMLEKAYEKGIILSGISAGAICWFRYGSSDSRMFMKNTKNSKSLMRVRGLELLPITLSPHHTKEKDIRDPGMIEIMKRTSGVGLAVEDGAAILIQDAKYKVLTVDKKAGIKKIFKVRGKVRTKMLNASGTVSELIGKE